MYRCAIQLSLFDTPFPDYPAPSAPLTSGTDIANFSLTARRAITTHPTIKETTMAWTKPEFTDWRFGFEITMYIANR
jgi:pyrroloquinoline quinone biosynthesis protein A